MRIARPHDALCEAMQTGTLHRNFMGFTTTKTRVLIGLGASSIGDVWSAFAQNEKDADGYIKRLFSQTIYIVQCYCQPAYQLLYFQS